ncbi:alpha/beta hydrolase [Nostocoides sp. HKS02]|uniref:alpha/beta hydrolase n=1 Tax=Nostocoides sp. HKS02 TaxID=1813880 RepID=UPI0012B4C70D|nr:alpha/beta hydrolase [Tetrasphaera sp. HKS02]QGN57444.1 alpha/beta hydrolase fold domain-containing protein [Tetrasphaera sp. HKS02]
MTGSETTDPGAGVVVHRDVVYSSPTGFRPLSLDVYIPPAPRAVCVYLHGGGWRVGSRRQGPGSLSPTSWRRFARMAARGLAVVSADYRLSGEAQFPAQQDDVAAACAFVLDRRDELALGSGGLTVFGVSAGGHLAALHALTSADRAAVAAVAAWYPVTDLEAMPDDLAAVGGEVDRGAGSREALLLGAPAAAVPELARAASPVHHAAAGAPPFLLVHGDADVAVPLHQSERLLAALEAVGAQAELAVVPGQGHLFPDLPDDALDLWLDRTADFLVDHGSRA